MVGFPIGGMREYELNPRYLFKVELEALLAKALSAYPKSEQERLLMNRRRPQSRKQPSGEGGLDVIVGQ